MPNQIAHCVLFLQVIYFSHAVEEERERARLDKKQELRWLHQAEELANRRKSMHAVRMYSRKKERNKKQRQAGWKSGERERALEGTCREQGKSC